MPRILCLQHRGGASAAGGVEIGLGKDENGGGMGTSGSRSGGDGGSSDRVTFDDTVQEAEDLEALLEGGYRESSAGPGGGGVAGSGKGANGSA